jgi:hypothetical protein
MVKRKRVLTLVLASQVGGFLLALVIIVGMPVYGYYKAQTLKERGVRADATVTKLYTSTGKNSTYYNVAYSYPVSPKSIYSATDQTNIQYFNTMRVGDVIPVAYDPDLPTRSSLNFDDMVFMRDNARPLYGALAITLPITLLLLVGPLVILLQYRGQKRLLEWGKVTGATIISDSEYNAGRAGRKSRVTYTFTDDAGVAVQGKRTGLPVKNSRKGAEYAEMFGDTTVIYDPDKSTKNMLYPLAFVDYISRSSPSIFSS